MPGHLSNGLTIIGYFTAVGLLFFGYRYAAAADNGWLFYGGEAAGTRALSLQTDRNEKAAFDATPILIEGMLRSDGLFTPPSFRGSI